MIQNLGESVDSVNKEHELLRKQVSDLLGETVTFRLTYSDQIKLINHNCNYLFILVLICCRWCADEVSFMKKQQAVQVAAPAAERNSDIWRRDMELGMKGLEVQLRQKQTQHDGMTLLSAQFTALQSNFTEMWVDVLITL